MLGEKEELDQDTTKGILDEDGPVGIISEPFDRIREIQKLLADEYRDAGDGRTLVREFVQNADDARATRLVFAVLHTGHPKAKNNLLHGPALLVANDGAFSAEDRKGIHKAIGGTKGKDADKRGQWQVLQIHEKSRAARPCRNTIAKPWKDIVGSESFKINFLSMLIFRLGCLVGSQGVLRSGKKLHIITMLYFDAAM